MDKNKQLIVIAGPTASGKTALAVDLALQHGAEVISADSRQIYKELNIGVAKPEPEELKGVTHHLIGHVSILEDYSAGRYEADAMQAITTCHQSSDTAILVGGTGLYIRAVTHGIDAFPDVPPSIVSALESELEMQGLQVLARELEAKDPLSGGLIDLHNPRRVIRALSVIRFSGLPFSSFKTEGRKQRPFEINYIFLQPDRQVLYDRIDQRVDLMMKKGLLNEVKNLLPYRQLKALDTVGYTELFDYLDGLLSLEQAVDKIKQHTRNYAKRQLTWFRKYNEEMKNAARFTVMTG